VHFDCFAFAQSQLQRRC